MAKSENPSLYELHPMLSGKGGYYQSKVTLLDLLAGMAMAGMVDSSNLCVGAEKGDAPCAFRAYEIAKAMLKERENVMKGETT